nr:asparagine synthetase B [Candidatus Dadabacteria bacterium]
MGSICGIFNFNNKPADPGLLYRINNIYPNRGPDRHFEWVDGNVGLGSRILFTTIESTKEQQPASSCDGNYLIVFDGILYNRTELISELINNQIHTDVYTDSEIIVNLYSLYGLKCLNNLNGD